MGTEFTQTILGSTNLKVHRLGLAGTYWPGKKTIYHAIDCGLNYFFLFNIDRQMVKVLRDVCQREREKYIISTGAYNLLVGYTNLRKSLENRLKMLRTDYIDIFMFLGITKEKHFPQKAQDELLQLREEGKVKFIGISCHDRKFAGELAAEGAIDVFMIRYNAAHRGAEQDIFPYLQNHNPGLVSYTATRWRYLLRRPPKWEKDKPVPTAGMCYRFVLSNPYVHVCLTAPSNYKQFTNNIAEVEKGPLNDEEMSFMQEFGDAVYKAHKRF